MRGAARLLREMVAAARRRRSLSTSIRCSPPGAYGCRRVAPQLKRGGPPCCVGLVADVMRERGLRACQPRADSAPLWPARRGASDQPDLVDREFTADAPAVGWFYPSA